MKSAVAAHRMYHSSRTIDRRRPRLPPADDSLAMNRLTAELQRLYFHPECANRAPGLVDPDGRVRAAVVSFEKNTDWPLAARFCHAVLDELELPAPAVSVGGCNGYRLWFSFGEPLAADQAAGFLNLLWQKYLGDLPSGRLNLWPGPDAVLPTQTNAPPLPPVADSESGRWSAFIDPELGSLFVEEPGLAMAPSDDRQADLLAGFASMGRDVVERALARLREQTEVAGGVTPVGAAEAPPLAPHSPGEAFADPKAFLLAVMNDPAVDLGHRIEAAKALLPWFAGEPRR
ncbi:MAG: hypothetical protein QM739_09795 [Propionivibrio sp.]